MQVNILPISQFSAPVPLFVHFVDFRKFRAGTGEGASGAHPTNISFFVFLYIFRGFRVMDEHIKKNSVHEIELHQQQIMYRVDIRKDTTMVHPPFFLMY